MYFISSTKVDFAKELIEMPVDVNVLLLEEKQARNG